MTCPACGFGNDEGTTVCFRCGHDLFVVTAGTLLGGRYEVVHRLGKGGMGTVYKAHDRELEEVIAVKVLRGDAAAGSDLARRFRSEIKLARKVRHRNVCAIHEYGQHGPLPYIVMELIEGVDLKQILHQRGRLPPDEAIDLVVQITRGLQAIHEAGIVHRDLKTSNVMVDRAGVVRLMDFGIAKRFGESGDTMGSGATMTGQVVGTPEYMSPEQARGERVDARSDIYSMGVLFFEVLTGAVPFKAETPVATLLKHLQEPAPLEDGNIPPELIPVLKRSLAKDRESRFATARELMDALRQARPAFTPSAATPRLLPTLGSLAPRTETESIATPVPTSAPTAVPTVIPTRVPTRVPTHVPTHVPTRPAGRPASPRWWPAAAVGAAVVGGGLLLVMERMDRPGAPVAVTATPLASPVAMPVESPPAPVAPEATAPRPPPSVRVAPPPPPSTRPVVSTTVPPRPPPITAAAPPPTTVTHVAPPTTVPPPPPAAASGTLRLRILPWARVSVDGEAQGTTPLPPLTLPAGTHVIQLDHPRFRPLRKTVRVPPGGVARLEVDLSQEAFPR